MIADAKALVGSYLRGHPDIVALGVRVSAKMPNDFAGPWVLMTELGAGDRSAGTDHLVSHLLQFDVYSSSERDGTTVEANLIGRAVRAALRALTPSDVPGWTPSVVAVNGPRDLGDDTNFEPARARTLVDAEILLHPVVGS